MKAFYLLLLMIGLFMAGVMQMVDIAIPRDAWVASVLSWAPTNWEISLDDSLKSRLDHHDVKAELVIALKKRASFRNQIYSQNFWEGAGLIVLSAIGLIRERKIDRMRKTIDLAAAPNSGPAGAAPTSVS
jgi:hypothetical protein